MKKKKYRKSYQEITNAYPPNRIIDSAYGRIFWKDWCAKECQRVRGWRVKILSDDRMLIIK